MAYAQCATRAYAIRPYGRDNGMILGAAFRYKGGRREYTLRKYD